MASTTLGSDRKAFHALGLLSLLLLIQQANAYDFKVGGTNVWTVPADPNTNSYNEWAERTRFQIGDTLLFVYPADKDSVLLVTKKDYTNCSTTTPLEKYNDGHTVFKFNHSGPFYFISGVEDNCRKNEKLVVVVLADRSNRSSTESPPPSPSAPAGEESPSPPAGSVEINPSPAPSQESSPPKNAASSTLLSFVGSLGTLVASFVFLL